MSRRSSHLLVPLVLGACAGADRPADPDDVFGPFTGPAHRFVVDDFRLVGDASPGDDLDGNGDIDGQLWNVFQTMASDGLRLLNTHGADQIKSGVIADVVWLQADDLADDPTVGLRWIGPAAAVSTPVLGGRLVDGRFTSNRTFSTHAPGSATVRLPVFRDADPMDLFVEGFAVELTADGAGGYDGVARGAVWHDQVLAAFHQGAVETITANPQAGAWLAAIIDPSYDGVMSLDDFAGAAVIASLLAPDVALYDGDVYWPGALSPEEADMVSIAFAFHLRACSAGSCTLGEPDGCFDRVRDGDETDVDCGGACQPCGALAGCADAADCWSGACVEQACAEPSCADGLQDGFESDVDCGAGCGGCASGETCRNNGDCASWSCQGGTCG